MRAAVIFDMDGVLVDVSQSYRIAIQETLRRYIKRVPDPNQIQEYKNMGGFNNDWDLTAHILREEGLTVPKDEVISEFQAIYLGQLINGEYTGLIACERWLTTVNLLEKVNRRFSIGLVTGRPRMEAVYTLRRFGVERYFQSVITMDDLPPEKGKPQPDGILKSLAELGADRCWYLGDTVDDMRAARAAGVTPLGVIPPNLDRVNNVRIALLNAGAALVLDTVCDAFTRQLPVAPELFTGDEQ